MPPTKIPPFIDFTESEVGFWVDQWYNPQTFLWEVEDRPIVWADRQRRALAYLLDLDAKGRIKFNNILWIDIGKTAKTLLSAAVADWLGRFFPQQAELVFAANSKDQADARAFQALKESLDRNPYLADFAEIVGTSVQSSTLIQYHDTQNRVTPVATKAKSQAGKNPIFIGIDEFHGWEGEGARQLYAELKPSPTRNISLVFKTTYPGFIDDDGPLNDQLDAAFDNEGNPKEGWEKVAGLDDLPLWVNGNQAVWWNHEPYEWHVRPMASGMTFLEELQEDKSLLKGEYLRIWQAIRTQRLEVFLPIDEWDKLVDEEWTGLGPQDRNVPVVGSIDLGIKFDSLATVWRGYDTVTGQYPLMAHKIMTPEMFQALGKDPFEWTFQYVLDMDRMQNVLAVYYDPWQMYHLAGRLRAEGVNMVEISQQSGRTKADTDYRALIIQGTPRNYKHTSDLRRHVKNAIGREVGQGSIRLDKKMTTMVIDGAVGDSMCCLAVTDHIEQFKKVERARHALRKPLVRRGAGNVRAIYRMGEGFRG